MAQIVLYTDHLEQTAALFGSLDAHAKAIEEAFDVTIRHKDSDRTAGSAVLIEGAEKAVSDAQKVLLYLQKMCRLNGSITAQNVHYAVRMVVEGQESELSALDDDCICMTMRAKPIKAKTVGQSRYVEAIRNHTIVFGLGPAGTGKTFLAVAMAVTALRNQTVSKIILTRPAVEAGERLGYLPGDLQSKIDPYLRPLHDALSQMFGQESYARYLEKGTIEIAPLAYMRGRTLDDAFLILDEAQNTTPQQMKMLLTRLGQQSKLVVTGDLSQTDLPYGQRSGLAEAVKILDGIEDIAIHHFTDRDVVRHRLVQQIILAYEDFEKKRAEQRVQTMQSEKRTDKQ
jgi:phosphate starvation-inducible PhoH-like protein